jgi:hypothetical protein
MTSRLLAESPARTTRDWSRATRGGTGDYYFNEIAHCVTPAIPHCTSLLRPTNETSPRTLYRGVQTSAQELSRREPPLRRGWDSGVGGLGPDAQYAIVEFLIGPAQIRIRPNKWCSALHRAVRTRCAAAVGRSHERADALRRNRAAPRPASGDSEYGTQWQRLAASHEERARKSSDSFWSTALDLRQLLR